MTTEKLADEVKTELTNTIIPFWGKLRDEKFGGYYGFVDFDLHIDKTAPKGCILNSRILWFFANAYKMLNKPNLLEAATHAFNFMLEHCFDSQNGGVFWSLDYKGFPLDTTKHTYNQAFAIYALSSYYAITHDERAIRKAFDLVQIIETKCRDEIGYCEAFTLDFNPEINDKLSENGIIAEKTMNTFLHVFEGYTELYRVTKDSNIASYLKRMLDQFVTKIWNPKKQRQEVFFDKNMNSLIDLHSYGHDIEAAWLLDRGTEILGDIKYTQLISPITKALTEKIYNTAYQEHSLLSESENGINDNTRVWWVQAETMVGFMNGYQKSRDQSKYLQAVYDVWEYIKRYIHDSRPYSEWFWSVNAYGVPKTRQPIVEPWKCPYHNGRMCMEIITRCKALEKEF
ncbi:MAG: N-acylglucosamine 2-epimerase [Treponema sp. CETP13]|nr:MAG: N-acylglucosamine 2-epimerase [Treponema sp. CETP13]